MSFCPTPFVPATFLKNPHLQTMLPRCVRIKKLKYQRQLHLDSTGLAVMAYDFVISQPKDPDLFVLFHGLEGSSQSPYAKTFANFAKKMGKNAVIVHYRGCGGLENNSHLDYNAGDTQEMHHVLGRLGKLYPNLFVMGVSLGGNLLARYAGEYGDDARLHAAVVVSAPVDLASSAKKMHQFVARHVYTPYLLRSLLKKAAKKDPSLDLSQIRFIDDFDEIYTAPRHGYRDKADYYARASALPILKNITKPTLIVSAKDDPFLGKVATDKDICACVHLYYPKHGGHTGFLDYKHGRLCLDWLPSCAFEFFEWATKSNIKPNA